MGSEGPKQSELDWIQLRTDMDSLVPETTWDRGVRKFHANPFVPVGCAATVAALSYGIWNFLKGRELMSQYMMRARVIAQGATIVAMVFSLTGNLANKK